MSVPDALLLADRQQWTADWGETSQPVLFASGTLYQFPRPVQVFRFRDTWDFERYKVPLKDGETLSGQSRRGVTIIIKGQIASQNGDDKLTAADMFAEIETMRSMLNANETNGKFELFLFYETTTSYYRKFRNCSTIRFELDLSNRLLFSYAAELHSDDLTLYSTAPGE